MLARFVTLIALFTKYAVPISVEVTAAFSAAVIDPDVRAPVGADVSITSALEFASDPDVPGDPKIKDASKAAASLMVPPFRNNADVEM
jgi:hypothetical protein